MLTDYGMTYERLTVAQLETAAADLDNAALVIKHAGHFRGALVNRLDGSVCLVGAVDLATYKKLNKLGEQFPNLIPRYGEGIIDLWNAQIMSEVWDAGKVRAENAYLVLGDFVPTGLCIECDDEDRYARHTDEYGSCRCSPREAWEIVVHYNDKHCISPTLAQNMLRQAAIRARTYADVKRRRNASIREMVTA